MHDPQPNITPDAANEPQIFSPEEAGNVSSAQLDQKEINDIAQELKKSLKAPEEALEPDPAAPIGPQAVPIDVQPAPGPIVGQAGPHGAAKGPGPDDTIYIDKDGKLHAKDETDGVPPAPGPTTPPAPTVPAA